MEQVPERGDSSGQYGLGEKLRGIFDGQENKAHPADLFAIELAQMTHRP